MKRDNLTHILSVIITAAVLAGPTAAFAGSLLIENVTLIDGTGRPPLAGASVLVTGDRISLVMPPDRS